MNQRKSASPKFRLWAAALALLAAVVLFAATQAVTERELRRDAERFGALPATEKLGGIALPRQVFLDPDLLPVYGSSELTQPQTNRADEFFAHHPTGFGAFLIGNPGETCLMIATKLAAAGSAARGRKVAVFLSPGWFLTPELDHPGFGFNFSPLQGDMLAFESTLSDDLKQDFARRLLGYPEIIRQNPLLQWRLQTLAEGGKSRVLGSALIYPLALVQDQLQRAMDYFRVGTYWWSHRAQLAPQAAGPASNLQPVAWTRRLQEADAAYARQPALTSYSTGPRTGFDDFRQKLFRDPKQPQNTPDQNFAQACLNSREWTDYQLLLRTAAELKVHLLVVCQPLNAKFCQLQGLTPRSSDLFYARLQACTAPYKAKLATFAEEERDPHFYRDCVHPSAKAWVAYDQTLDAFYHQAFPHPPL